MLTDYPVSIATHGVALNITVQSYNGSLDYGLTACRKAMPDVPELAALMRAAHEELLRLTPVGHATAAAPPPPLKLVSKKKAAAPARAAGAPRVRRKAA